MGEAPTPPLDQPALKLRALYIEPDTWYLAYFTVSGIEDGTAWIINPRAWGWAIPAINQHHLYVVDVDQTLIVK